MSGPLMTRLGKRHHPALAALRFGPMRRYLIGQLPSVTCSWAQVVALSWVVVDRDPHALGWVMAAQFLPSLIFGPWFGVVADRHDRRHLLMLAEAGLGLVALSYALVSAAGQLTLPFIYLLAAVWGTINALDTPARRALVPMLVPAEQGRSASALTGTVLLVGMTAGSALGAALVATAGVTVTFAVNAASFLADLAVLGGSLAGMLTAAARGTPGPLRRAALLMVASLTVTAAAPSLPVEYAGLVGAGFAWSLLLNSVICTLQTADAAMLGRVMSLFAVVLLGGNAAGGPVAALTAALAGPRAPFALGAVAALVAAASVARPPGSRAAPRRRLGWPSTGTRHPARPVTGNLLGLDLVESGRSDRGEVETDVSSTRTANIRPRGHAPPPGPTSRRRAPRSFAGSHGWIESPTFRFQSGQAVRSGCVPGYGPISASQHGVSTVRMPHDATG
jgi:Transmembrane secretion effector